VVLQKNKLLQQKNCFELKISNSSITVLADCWQVVNELLGHAVDPNQALTHGLNSALCVATLPLSETNRSPPARIALVGTSTLYCLPRVASFIMVALWNRADHYIFMLWFLSSIYLFSSPDLSGRALDVYHTSTHGVALVQI